MLFTGAALYVSLVEHPTRMSCGTKIAATEFVPSHKRGAVMQGSLAVVSSLTGLAAWRLGGDVRRLAGAVLIGAGGAVHACRRQADERPAFSIPRGTRRRPRLTCCRSGGASSTPFVAA
jgi:hypothetical protein